MTTRVIDLTRYRLMKETEAARKEIWAAAEAGNDQRFESAKLRYANALHTFERLNPSQPVPVIEPPGRVGGRVKNLIQ
jgi:glutathione S-transferase